MKYTDKEQWILSQGNWIGMASVFIALSIVIYLKIPIEENTWFMGIFLGFVFILLGLYSSKKAHEEDINNGD